MERGVVTASRGRSFVVRLEGAGAGSGEGAPSGEDDGALRFDCVARKKNVDFACGDEVEFEPTAPGQGVIVTRSERRSELRREDGARGKVIAANATRMFFVCAFDVRFDDNLAARALAAAKWAGVDAVLLANKADLPDSAGLGAALGRYRGFGYRALSVSALGDLSDLRAEMAGQTSVFVGASGVGKSSLANAILGFDAQKTGAVSLALSRGRHTTTSAALFRLPQGGAFIDSPGLQSFGLAHIPPSELIACFLDLAPYAGRCRFNDCSHAPAAPGCALRQAAASGAADPARLQTFLSLQEEIKDMRKARRGR